MDEREQKSAALGVCPKCGGKLKTTLVTEESYFNTCLVCDRLFVLSNKEPEC